MKKQLLLYLFLFGILSFSFAQEVEVDDSLKAKKNDLKNTLRFDLSGRAFYYSLNYDRKISVKNIDIHTTIGVGDLSSRSVSFNTSLYLVPNYWLLNPIIGAGHISLFSERIANGPTGLLFTGLNYNKLQKWNFQVLFTRLFFFYEKDNSQFWGGLSFGYKF